MQSLRSVESGGAGAERAGANEFRLGDVVGESPAFRDVLAYAKTVATTDATVLLCGETGTGKEVIANAIHDFSLRRRARMVKLNVAAIPATLLESELLGHERGAFTGATTRRTGRFELAHDGTLFLDEIGEMPMELQPKLLRLLQEREYERLGGGRTLRSDARLIVATNRDLSAMVASRLFREDLFYRLNVFPIHLPALRERPEDIPLLAARFAERYARKLGRPVPTISLSSIEALRSQPWPGNVRELQNVIERAVILSSPGGELVFAPARHAAVVHPGVRRALPTLDDVQRAHIISVLESTGWVIGGARGAAAKLGMKRTTLNFRLKKLGISPRPAPPPPRGTSPVAMDDRAHTAWP